MTDPIPSDQLTVGITNPFDIQNGDTIELCGMAFVEDPDAITFNWYLGYFSCSQDIQGGNFTQYSIMTGSDTGDGYGKVCFGGSYTFTANGPISCDDHWVVGMNAQTVGGDSSVRFTYTLKVSRPCS